MKDNKIAATIQVDMDPLWSQLEYYGHSGEIHPDVFYETGLPRFLDLFRKNNVKATFFVVGKDAENKHKKELLKQIREEGHEIANHSFSHPLGLSSLPKKEIETEVRKAENAIKKITGMKPAGFKAPRWDLSSKLLDILEENNYVYDASLLPTFTILPIYLFERIFGRKKLNQFHGPNLSSGFAPLHPYTPSIDSIEKIGEREIVEIPNTVVPIFRFPYHSSPVFLFGLNFFRVSYFLTRKRHLPLNYEFHLIDLADNIADKRIPSYRLPPLEKRMRICRFIVKALVNDYRIVTSRDLAEEFKPR